MQLVPFLPPKSWVPDLQSLQENAELSSGGTYLAGKKNPQDANPEGNPWNGQVAAQLAYRQATH